MPDDGLRISPTAQYTSYVWFRNGLSHPALASREGRFYYRAFWPLNRMWERLGSTPGLERSLLTRHQLIDRILSRAIEAGEIHQVVEIAAGYSARGFRFAGQFPQVTYVEGDLAKVAAAKRARLDAACLRGANHDVRTLDALADGGPDSLAQAVAALDPTLGTAIVTEGLLGYLDPTAVAGIWRRIASALGGFRHGLYLSDIILSDAIRSSTAARAFRVLLQAFVRGRTHAQAENAMAARGALATAGFARTTLHVPEDGSLVRILEATVR